MQISLILRVSNCTISNNEFALLYVLPHTAYYHTYKCGSHHRLTFTSAQAIISSHSRTWRLPLIIQCVKKFRAKASISDGPTGNRSTKQRLVDWVEITIYYTAALINKSLPGFMLPAIVHSLDHRSLLVLFKQNPDQLGCG